MPATPEAATLLITGGAGYIGAHTCVALQRAGYRLVVLDNHCNSSPDTLERASSASPGSRWKACKAMCATGRCSIDCFARMRSGACCTLPG
jgi:nucleoside-diphosphate-sugar epimerase